jgi:predicted nuclease with RNAse H fold
LRYCGVVCGREYQHLCALEEVRTEEPPIRLAATFFEPGRVDQIVQQVRMLGDVIVAVAAPLTDAREGGRACDAELRRLGVMPQPPLPAARELAAALADLGAFVPEGPGPEGAVEDGVFQRAGLFETNADGVFCALQGRRLPAKRHPFGIQLRVHELEDDHVLDDDEHALWARRIEEIEAAATALCAHRYAVGHACWVGDPAEGVVVLPGSQLPERFSPEGVLPPLRRVPLP